MTSNWWKIIVVLTRDAKGVLKGVLRCLLEKNRTSDSTSPSLEDKWVLEGVYMKGGGPALLVGLALVGVGLVENAECGVPECGVTECGVTESRSAGVPE